ncbi:MAG: hypothetical protein U9R47_02725, partial [Actinomycetota bacterium]|nr:hypothetical protein [Actinomycetota bacterium]
QAPDRPPALSFGSWDELPSNDPSVVVVCHPDWRGVRTAAYSFREPTVECDDLTRWGRDIVDRLRSHGVAVVVVHGFPPGAAGFLAEARAAGIGTRVVLHSSMTQHGAEPGEAEVADTVLALSRDGTIDRVGFVKAGLSEAFTALGYPTAYVPNRTPDMPKITPRDLGPGLHVGVFAESFWRKNVVTQLAAVVLLNDATAHVLQRPDVQYLDGLSIVQHGVVPWEEFISLQASTDLNLYATLSECHPLSPIESYLSGVPALVSRTSDVFRSDPALWDLTTVEIADDPVAIAAAAQRLIEHRDDATARATLWISENDQEALRRWVDFVTPASLSL